MQDIINQWLILSLLPMCTTDAGLSIRAVIVLHLFINVEVLSSIFNDCELIRLQ